MLEVADLAKHFPMRGRMLDRALGRAPRVVRAVDGISFAFEPGETLGLVSESGCGKTTTARLVLRASIFDQPARLLQGELPSPIDLPRGCRFASRCPHRFDRCTDTEPRLLEAGPGHVVACHLYTGGGSSSSPRPWSPR